MAKTIQSKGELWLPQDKFDNRDSSNTLEEGVEYNIIDSVGYATAKYVDDKVSTKTSVTVGGSNVATFNADTKQDKLTASEPLQLSSNGELSFSYGNGFTVEYGGLQLSLNTSNPLYYYDGTLGIGIGNGITTDSNNNLTININESQLTTSNGYLELSSNILNSGFHSSDGSYIQDNYGNLDVYGHGELRLTSDNNIQINPTIDSYKTIIASGTTDNKALGIVLDDSGETITMGTLSDYMTVDKTKPYIEITKTAVNIKGLNQIS